MSTMLRMNSDPSIFTRNQLHFDQQSEFISGNISPSVKPVEDYYSEEEWGDEEIDHDVTEEENQLMLDEKIKQADDICFENFGVRILETVAGSLLSGKIDKDDIVLQAMAYKCQKILRGKSGIRYKDSWGMYWCGIRTLVKGRALTPFIDHFELPTKLSKYKAKVLDCCGLNSETLGKAGLQVQNTNLWLSGRKEEVGDKTLCLSVSVDGKKIAMSSDGQEDMAGILGDKTNQQVDSTHEEETVKVLKLLRDDHRKSFYMIYDSLSSIGKSLVEKLSAIEVLTLKNKKQLQKNPNLAKYLFVLNQQSASGKALLKCLGKLQFQIAQLISEKRMSTILLSENGTVLDIGTQPNFYRIQQLGQKDDLQTCQKISGFQTGCKVLLFPWSDLKDYLRRPTYQIPKSSKSFHRMVDCCQILSSNIFEACGLSQIRPVQDMIQTYQRVTSQFFESIEHVSETNSQSTASFVSTFASMTYGNNCRITESGLFCEGGVGALPDLLVKDVDGKLEYIIMFKKVEINTCRVTTEMVATCIASSHICKPSKGCLLVIFSLSSMVIHSIGLASKLAQDMLTFLKTYVSAPKCLKKRSKEQCDQIIEMKANLANEYSNIITLGTYPIVEEVQDSWDRFDGTVKLDKNEASSNPRSPGTFVKPDIKEDLVQLLDDVHRYIAKQARELIIFNVSEMSGNPSKFPHTILAASFLSSASLKVVVKSCLAETIKMIESHPSAPKVLNIGCDGESLHLVTKMSRGEPGTLLALTKHMFELVKSFNKRELAILISKNPKISISEVADDFEEEAIHDTPGDIAEYLSESIASILNEKEVIGSTLEDIENWLTPDPGSTASSSREAKCKEMKKVDLCLAAVKFILPKARRDWLQAHYGSESISVVLSCNQFQYTPSTVFEKTPQGYFTTVSFDMAHMSNLFREAVAKNKLSELGLPRESMLMLSKKDGFSYLKNILSVTGSKLDYDPMNQRASSLCFSEKTEKGLAEMGELKAAKLCKLLRLGIIEALDKTGLSSEDRIQHIYSLKCYLDDEIDPVHRLKRPGKESISNELLQMVHASLDSHIVTFLNMAHFNARRKSTLTCEQFFGMITLMADGGRKLDCRQISDILERCTIINALRMTPNIVKGFKFLSKMKVHMTSYEAEHEDDNGITNTLEYPSLTTQKRIVLPSNSVQDILSKKRKRLNSVPDKPEMSYESMKNATSNVRRFTKKFTS